MEGLRRLEYRGYDSAGVALVTGAGNGTPTGHARSELVTAKKAGKLANLVADLAEHPLPGATAAIGHTRWATHGAPTDVNAHPHVAGPIAVIHNGIVENFALLKAELVADGVIFRSETDTEVTAHLLARAYAVHGDLSAAMCTVARRLTGTFTLLAVHADVPDVVVGARHDSPLVVGIGVGENFLGSDVAAFIAHTREALELGQDQVVTITPDGATVTDFHGVPAQARRFTVDWDAAAAEKGGFASFMDKEIHDQPQAVADTLLGRTDVAGRLVLDDLRIEESVLRSIDKIVVIACGTAAYAGHVAKYAIEHWCRIPVEVELAHEFRYRDPVVNARTLVVAISQPSATLASRAHTCSRSATRTARPSRASPMRCSTPTPDPRSRSPPPRRSWRRSPRPTCSGSTSPSCAETSFPTRSARSSTSSARCRPRSSRYWTAPTRSGRRHAT